MVHSVSNLKARQTSSDVPSKGGSRWANALPPEHLLDEYRIESILGAGGFGITYKAFDTHLQQWVAIKEYFPIDWSFRDADGVTVRPNTQGQENSLAGQADDYSWGLERFLDEARVLARIQHPFVVRVKRYFRAHGTAYIVMDFEEGEPLNAILHDGETLREEDVRGLLEDVLPALQAVHEQGYLHRDIKPANLYRRVSDHRVILIDFGAARAALGRQSKSVTSLVTPGYSPPEQYTTRSDRYGTWSDIYALGAVLYRCIIGRTPTEAAERLLDDTLEPAVQAGAGRYDINLLKVIDQALALRPEQRFGTVAEMQAALANSTDANSDDTVVMAPLLKPGHRPEAEQITERPAVPVFEPLASSQQKSISPSPEDYHPSGRRSVIASSVATQAMVMPTRRRRLIMAVAGGVALTALAGTVPWLWRASPEDNSLPRSHLDQRPGRSAASPTQPDAPLVTASLPSAPQADAAQQASPPTVSPPVTAKEPIPEAGASAPDPHVQPLVTPSASALSSTPIPVAPSAPLPEPAPPLAAPVAETPPPTPEPSAAPLLQGHDGVQTATEPSSTLAAPAEAAEVPVGTTTPATANPAPAIPAVAPSGRSHGGAAAATTNAAKNRPPSRSRVGDVTERHSAIRTQEGTRSRGGHGRRTPVQSSLTAPAAPIQRAPITPMRSNSPWGSPASTGYNQR